MRLHEAQLCGVLDRHDALVGGNRAREHVEQRRLAGARAARDHDVLARRHRAHEEAPHLLGQRAEAHEVLELERVPRELADRDARAAERERLDDRVDARAVLEARVDERSRLVDAPSERRDDALDDRAHALVVREAKRRVLDLARALDEDRVRVDDHDLVDALVGEQQLERAEPERLVAHLLDQLGQVRARRQVARDRLHDALERVEHLRAHDAVVHLRAIEAREVEMIEQHPVQAPTHLDGDVLGAVPVPPDRVVRGRRCRGGLAIRRRRRHGGDGLLRRRHHRGGGRAGHLRGLHLAQLTTTQPHHIGPHAKRDLRLQQDRRRDDSLVADERAIRRSVRDGHSLRRDIESAVPSRDLWRGQHDMAARVAAYHDLRSIVDREVLDRPVRELDGQQHDVSWSCAWRAIRARRLHRAERRQRGPRDAPTVPRCRSSRRSRPSEPPRSDRRCGSGRRGARLLRRR